MKLLAKMNIKTLIRGQSRFSSSMFGSQFVAQEKEARSDGRKVILHLNVSHSDQSLVSAGARTFLANIKFPHSVTEMNLWKDRLTRELNPNLLNENQVSSVQISSPRSIYRDK